MARAREFILIRRIFNIDLCSIPSLLPNGFIDTISVFAPFANSAYWNMCSGGVPKKKIFFLRNNEMSHAHGPYLICQITDKHLISTPAQTTDLRLLIFEKALVPSSPKCVFCPVKRKSFSSTRFAFHSKTFKRQSNHQIHSGWVSGSTTPCSRSSIE